MAKYTKLPPKSSAAIRALGPAPREHTLRSRQAQKHNVLGAKFNKGSATKKRFVIPSLGGSTHNP